MKSSEANIWQYGEKIWPANSVIETTFWPKLCVVQIASEEEAVAIDRDPVHAVERDLLLVRERELVDLLAELERQLALTPLA